jgi:CTP synthase (UTP-ammonia lyase)
MNILPQTKRMMLLRIGLIGDYNPAVIAHQAIPRALDLAAAAIGNCRVEPCWLATESLVSDLPARLSGFNGLWCVPASPYASMDGALDAIRFARIQRVPFLGTCGGFQHALIEYARNALGMTRAEHAETSPNAALTLIARLSCSLVEQEGRILLQEGSRIRQIYGRSEVHEQYHCNFGLNPAYAEMLAAGQLQFTGRDGAGEPRALELDNHPFFIATLFQPERSALRGEAHPLILAYIRHLSSC